MTYEEKETLSLDDFVSNPTPRIAVSLCLDSSGSMSGQPIDELNKGVEAFYEEIYADEIARYSAEIGIVTFGPARLETDFQTLEEQPRAPRLVAHGATPLGEALKLSLDALEARKQKYRNAGIEYYQPWLVVMTDGYPCGGSSSLLNEQVKRCAKLVREGKLTVFPIGVGCQFDSAVLSKLSPINSPIRLQGLSFREFFRWLSASVSRVSQSTPGDSVKLDVAGIRGWGEI